MTNIVQNMTLNGKSVDGVLGFEPGTAGWKVQMNPLRIPLHFVL